MRCMMYDAIVFGGHSFVPSFPRSFSPSLSHSFILSFHHSLVPSSPRPLISLAPTPLTLTSLSHTQVPYFIVYTDKSDHPEPANQKWWPHNDTPAPTLLYGE